jgi:hypothetical protein
MRFEIAGKDIAEHIGIVTMLRNAFTGSDFDCDHQAFFARYIGQIRLLK